MIVVDTNIIGYLFLNSDRSHQVEQILQKDPQWIAPKLWRSEFSNVLVLYVRKQILCEEAAQEIMELALKMMDNNEYEVNSLRVMQLAIRSNCSAYDCEFVALAAEHGIALVTVDKQVLQNFKDIAVSPEEYLSDASNL